MSKPQKPYPVRPAPLPPTNGYNRSKNEVRPDLSELDRSFDLPPPSMPAPPLPPLSGASDPGSEGPPPPPRVDSFELTQDSLEEPISPFLLTLPPAPPLPPNAEVDPPPIPQRPSSKFGSGSGQTLANAPPILPPRTQMTSKYNLWATDSSTTFSPIE